MKLFKYLILFGSAHVASKFIGEEKAWRFVEKINREKKLHWLKKNNTKFKFEGNAIDQVFDIYIKGYFKAGPEDIEVVNKTERLLKTRWSTYCPVLKACEILNLDTRVVCRRAYERPAQEFLTEINPALKFSRNYEKIRPYAEYCEETIEVID